MKGLLKAVTLPVKEWKWKLVLKQSVINFYRRLAATDEKVRSGIDRDGRNLQTVTKIADFCFAKI